MNWQLAYRWARNLFAIVGVLGTLLVSALVGYAMTMEAQYERRTADGAGHHLIDPRTGHAAVEVSSVTVVAPTAMAADGLATAAFVLGPEAGRRLLEEQGVEGLFVTSSGELRQTAGLRTASR